MAKLSKGTTFVNGTTYSAADLNNLVDGADILPGAISEQTALAPTTADSFLFFAASLSALRKCTLQNIIDAFPSDAIAANKSLRTLGTGATQSAPGNDTRFPASVTGLRLAAGAGSTDVPAVPKDLSFPEVNLSAGLNIDWDAGDVFYDTLPSSASNPTYTFSNVRAGRSVTIILKKGSWTGTTVTWPTLLGTVPAYTTTATACIYTFINTTLGVVGAVKSV